MTTQEKLLQMKTNSKWKILFYYAGAKYVSDRKGFRKLLHQELMSGCYDILYLHLGSNDVCCKDSDFYRGTVEELLPVDKERKQHAVGTESHVPSVRYMDYGATKQKSLYLSHDGLHLSAEGARRCLASIQDDLPNQLCVEAAVQDPTEWPALSATEVPVQEHDSTIALFSDIVQTGAQPEIQDKVDASEVPVPRDIKPQTHKITVVTARAKRSATRNTKRYGKKKHKKMEVKTGKVKREKPTMTKKKNKQVPCYNCPNCRVCCSSEDALLDHFIRKHSSWKVDRPDTLYNQEDEINVPYNIHCHRDTEETPQQDDNAANEDQVNVPSHFFFQ
ncbi:uncharacterized protein LOC127856927 isoform X3 [Dreissena polymorpha]|uniref:uncharacterized protein LOC127856927 isoform X3 n=1 Tax=Dreissena polymorpha TaxID=45954 RepID=UPI00226527FB|nr:uncharacterized protein LOC127856927 isoform X3 [Dreissena polymorpha]